MDVKGNEIEAILILVLDIIHYDIKVEDTRQFVLHFVKCLVEARLNHIKCTRNV